MWKVMARKRGKFGWHKEMYRGEYFDCCAEQMRLFNDGYDAYVKKV